MACLAGPSQVDETCRTKRERPLNERRRRARSASAADAVLAVGAERGIFFAMSTTRQLTGSEAVVHPGDDADYGRDDGRRN